MTLLKEIQYALFGRPLDITMGPDLHGETVHVEVKPVNWFSIIVMAILVLMFIGFMLCLLVPLCRTRRRVSSDAEKQHQHPYPLLEEPIDPAEHQRTLMAWLNGRSRDRFSRSLAPGMHRNGSSGSGSSKRSMPTIKGLGFFRRSTVDLIPTLSHGGGGERTPVLVLTPPPPAYASPRQEQMERVPSYGRSARTRSHEVMGRPSGSEIRRTPSSPLSSSSSSPLSSSSSSSNSSPSSPLGRSSSMTRSGSAPMPRSVSGSTRPAAEIAHAPSAAVVHQMVVGHAEGLQRGMDDIQRARPGMDDGQDLRTERLRYVQRTLRGDPVQATASSSSSSRAASVHF